MRLLVFCICLSLFSSDLFGQGLSLPYYTGFDTPAEKAGWQQYRTGFLSNFAWNTNGAISHDYNVGGNSTDTVIDWFVSPPLNFTSPGKVSMKVLTSGFSVPTVDNCEVWYGTKDQDPSTGNFTLIANLSYMLPQGKWLDTMVNIPFASDSGYIAFKYKTIGAAWATYSIDSITASTVVGIKKVNEPTPLAIKTIPNPFKSTSTLLFSSEIRNAQIEIYDIYGRKLRTVNGVSGSRYYLVRGNLPVGVYIIHLNQDGNNRAATKIVVSN